jgi:hypothetical protein
MSGDIERPAADRLFHGATNLKPNEILEQLKADNPRLFKGLEDKQALRVIQATLALLGGEVAGMEDGRLNVTGLGTFVVQSRQREGDATTVRRVTFRPGKAKAAAAEE